MGQVQELTLDAFQHDSLRFLTNASGRAVLADPMGARKTATVLAWLQAEQHRTDNGPTRVLVVAPASVHGHWLHEADVWFPDASLFRASGTRDQRAQAIEDAFSFAAPTLTVITYESAKLHERYLRKFDTVVFDEGHKLKGRRTDVALMGNDLAKAKRCIIVTGTPVLNRAAELWQYLHMLAPRVYPAFWRWASEHFRIEERRFKGSRFPTKIIHDYREGHLEMVQAQIAPFFLQRDIKDLFPNAAWIDEPEHVQINVELSAAERKAYDSLVKHHWAHIGAQDVATGGSLDLTTRLGQLVSDWSALGGDEPGSKVKAAKELIDNLLERDDKVLVLVKYKNTLHQLAAALKVNTAVYHGDLTQARRDEQLADFCSTAQASPRVMIGTLDSLSEGVDGMQHVAANIVMLDRHWVPAKNDQAIGRLRRSGQVQRVTVYHVFAENTIDATITDACLKKQNVIERLQNRPLTVSLYGG